LVTFPAGSVPAGTFVRAYPRTFQLIREIGEDPSFVRGDGGSAVVQASGDTSVLLVNPFGFATGDTPGDPVLRIDVLLLGQDGTRRLASAIELPIGAAQPWAANPAPPGGAVAPLLSGFLSAQGLT